MKAQLVVFDGPPGQEYQPVNLVASCATCRWAQVEVGRIMTCGRADEDGNLMQPDAPGGCAALVVAPDFGCVQWEGKV